MKKKNIIIISIVAVLLLTAAIVFFLNNPSDKNVKLKENNKRYSVGEIFEINGEKFYTLSDNINEHTVTGFAFYNIDIANLKQIELETISTFIKFSKENFWKNNSNKYPLDLEFSKESSSMAIADNYAKSLDKDATGTLITKTEFENIQSFIREYDGNFWLRTAYKEDELYVFYNQKLISMKYKLDGVLGVRPVITINKNCIDKKDA